MGQRHLSLVLLTGSNLCGCWFTPTRALLRHEYDVIQTPRLQLLDVGGVLANRDGNFLTPPLSVGGCDGQTVPVNLTLRMLPLDHRGRRGRLDDVEVGGTRDD